MILLAFLGLILVIAGSLVLFVGLGSSSFGGRPLRGSWSRWNLGPYFLFHRLRPCRPGQQLVQFPSVGSSSTNPAPEMFAQLSPCETATAASSAKPSRFSEQMCPQGSGCGLECRAGWVGRTRLGCHSASFSRCRPLVIAFYASCVNYCELMKGSEDCLSSVFPCFRAGCRNYSGNVAARFLLFWGTSLAPVDLSRWSWVWRSGPWFCLFWDNIS